MAAGDDFAFRLNFSRGNSRFAASDGAVATGETGHAARTFCYRLEHRINTLSGD
jgi:hypothetical protein